MKGSEWLPLPEWYKDDAVDYVELFQHAGHAGSSKLKKQEERIKTWHRRSALKKKKHQARRLGAVTFRGMMLAVGPFL